MAWLAASWSAGYAGLGLWWSSGRGTFPIGVGPGSGPAAPPLHGLDPSAGAAAVAVLGLVGVGVGVLLARGRLGGRVLAVSVGYAWILAIILLLLVPDARAVAVAAYGVIYLLGAPFGWPPGSFWAQVPWPVENQLLCLVGGFLWGATALAWSRRARSACVACGRGAAGGGWASPRRASRWGAAAAWLAAVAPLPYAFTRLAWSLGIPVGTSAEVLRSAGRSLWFPAGALALVAIAGSVLTLGLARSWGEVMPRWLPIVGGRRVPPFLAVVPASVVGVLVFAAGLGVARDTLRQGPDAWSAMSLVGLVWLVWGIALATAALGYHYRRRGRCARCGLGAE